MGPEGDKMPKGEDTSRREFLERLGAGALLGVAGVPGRHSRHLQNQRADSRQQNAAWTPPPVLKNPNILIIMVDQLRLPAWLGDSQTAALSQTVLPNIMGRLQANSYDFSQFFVAATACTPSRACLLTGLYPPQTAMYTNPESGSSMTPGLALNSAYPTWGTGMGVLNPAYAGNQWWFGKWHLSNCMLASPLTPYGFNTRTYPGGPGPIYNGSPNGVPNEGTDGGAFSGSTNVYASDALIAGDFIGWLTGQSPTPTPPAAPWCATVSLINPHDITSAPAWLQSSPFPPVGVAPQSVYFPPPAGPPPSFYTAAPSPWNYENLAQVVNKPTWQYTYQSAEIQQVGAVTDWVLFLNQYFWLQNFVDAQVGLILNALYSSPYAGNTVVIFLSDHGEYAGSHGLHGKGNAVYDESLRVPFYVQFPGQTGTIPMNQMCSSVDIFGLMCDLATGGAGQWRLAYPDLANRQSLWSFLYNNSSETRVAPGPVGLPYVLHTFDDAHQTGLVASKYHIVCLRTKQDLSNGIIGAKLAFYSAWSKCTTYPNSTPPDPEFYDYNPATTNNSAEMGNDYYSNNAVTQQAIEEYTEALGTLGPVSTGISGSELNRPLVGTGTDGNPLSQAQSNARQAFFSSTQGASMCNAPRG